MQKSESIHQCKDSGQYQLRQEVPVDLQELVRKKVIKRSLNTSDEGVARRLSAQYGAEYEELFQKLRGDRERAVDPGIFAYMLHCFRDQI
ncbi:DUF6538 domain-containing protein [Pseudodesulfovibrio sediminis]|uniref:DUF6538 domain-containing protein n=1 Tax=Pseudodesulfovibrio sediminis TaxID=2810563 RepID=A0ABN6EUA2_9BACT|nr:hypothetical protein PSDVSF_31450 [Pseudodesulfovibrio sediminis]